MRLSAFDFGLKSVAFPLQEIIVPTSQNDEGGTRGMGGGMIGGHSTNGADGGGQLRRSLRRLLIRLHFLPNSGDPIAGSWHLAVGDQITGSWHLAVLIAWLSTLLSGWLYGYYGQLPGRDEQDATPAVYALWWAVSAMTGVGAVSPLDSEAGLALATVYMVVGVPINSALLAMLIDRYLSRVQELEARRKVFAAPSLRIDGMSASSHQ